MMSQPWSPKVEITAEEAKKLIEGQFPRFKPVRISELGKGFDNSVYLVNDDFVFRFPRREIAVQLSTIENQLLPLLVNETKIEVPEPIFFGKPTDVYKWPFTGFKLVRGQSPGALTEETRNLSTVPLAEFLKKLHQFPIEKALEIGVPYDRFERMNLNKRKAILLDNIKKADELQLLDDAQTALDWLNSFNDLQLDSPLSLVHGDCHIRNVLVNELGVISGIIDWGDTHIGNPAIDLSIAYSFLPPSGRNQFFKVYGEVSEVTKLGAKFFALYVSIVLLLYAHDIKDARLIESSKESIMLVFS